MAYDLLRLIVVKSAVSQSIPSHVVVAVAVAATVGLAAVLEARLDAEEGEASEALIQRVIAHATRSGISIQATRELRAGTVNGNHQGWMTVETAVAPSGTFSWHVIAEGGSERTREKVLYELLKSEADVWRTGERDAAALTPTNYSFTIQPSTRAGQIEIRLTPRRQDPKLIDGVLTASSDGYPIRLEGRMAKSPSFWIRAVTVVKHYSRFAGIALPTSIESLADVKVFGQSSLTMRYRYTAVDGRSVSQAVVAAPFVGPSAEILLLHGSGSQQE